MGKINQERERGDRMSRLTEKNKFDTHYGISISKNLLQSAYDKLGKLEDLEEEIGCPLEVVFKALKQDYIYTKSGKHSRIEFGTYGFEWCICYGLRTQIRVVDYKKTWWLKEYKSE